MGVSYDLAGQQRVYEKWAPYYDRVYNRFLSDAHSRTARAAAAHGPDVLEVGVGTGLLLRYYPPESRVIGVDLSVHMLQKAIEKVREQKLDHVKLLASMDACRLGFRDESFDGVAVPFVITLVPDPEAALDEMRRVLRPGGEIVVTSKLGADSGVQARIEDVLAPAMAKVGWSSHFKVSRLKRWAESRPGMEFLGVEGVFPAGFFKMVRLKKKG